MTMNEIKFDFIKNVNILLNNSGIEERIIDIAYFNIKIVCKDFEIYCDINEDNKNNIIIKKTSYVTIININSLLMMICNYFDFIIDILNKKVGDINEV